MELLPMDWKTWKTEWIWLIFSEICVLWRKIEAGQQKYVFTTIYGFFQLWYRQRMAVSTEAYSLLGFPKSTDSCGWEPLFTRPKKFSFFWKIIGNILGFSIAISIEQIDNVETFSRFFGEKHEKRWFLVTNGYKKSLKGFVWLFFTSIVHEKEGRHTKWNGN